MSGVFQNPKILTPPPHRPASVSFPRPWCGVRPHSLGGEVVGINCSEDARHCSVLYICKYFMVKTEEVQAGEAGELDEG
jgi:hypothetical protein